MASTAPVSTSSSPAVASANATAPLSPFHPAARVMLVSIDGWGLSSETKGNAIANARTPTMSSFTAPGTTVRYLPHVHSHSFAAMCGWCAAFPCSIGCVRFSCWFT
jgi:hypothetical protein